MTKHYIWIGNGNSWPSPGWYVSNSGLRQNDYLYARVKTKAETNPVNRDYAIKLIRDMKSRGYEAKADPPIRIRETL